ncbi:MAG: 6-phosphogluconolactonase [Rhizobiaceae bacterium]
MDTNRHVRRDFSSALELAEALAARVAETLREAIAARGHATLAVSGGSTPVRFFEALSGKRIDWAKVTVTLVDERFVPPDHERSNEALVRRHLLKGEAASARFLGLWREADTVETAARLALLDLARLPAPLDVVVLGMGTDGHTASFFADAEGFDLLTAPACPVPLLPVKARSAGEPRLTLTLPVLAQARDLVLHIEGAEKEMVLARALAGAAASELPIRAILDHTVAPLQIFHAP